jgi:amidase
MCRTVADAAALLDVLTGEEHPVGLFDGSLADVRLAVPPAPEDLDATDRELFDAALAVLRDLGATAVEVPELPQTSELPVLHYEFARDLDAYLAQLPAGAPIRTMRQLADWNEAHADAALKYGQAHVLEALEVDHGAERAAYELHRARDKAVAGEQGIDATLRLASAAAVVVPSWYGAGVAARAGYPSLVVPAGYRRSGRKPLGVAFLGAAHTDAVLLALGYAYEQAAQARRPVSEVNPSLVRDARLP